MHNDGVYFYSAGAFLRAGDFARAAAVLAEGEQVAAAYPKGVEREFLLDMGREIRAFLAFVQGDCLTGVPLVNARTIRKDPSARIAIQACSPLTPASTLRANISWLEQQLRKHDPTVPYVPARYHARAGETALALRDWPQARRHSAAGLRIAKSGYKLYSIELQNALVLRAAEHALGNREAVAPLTARIIELSRTLGLEPPEEFNGRQDYLRLWRMVPAPQK